MKVCTWLIVESSGVKSLVVHLWFHDFEPWWLAAVHLHHPRSADLRVPASPADVSQAAGALSSVQHRQVLRAQEPEGGCPVGWSKSKKLLF